MYTKSITRSHTHIHTRALMSPHPHTCVEHKYVISYTEALTYSTTLLLNLIAWSVQMSTSRLFSRNLLQVLGARLKMLFFSVFVRPNGT